MAESTLPAFPYGAVYFRKSNPPGEDWAHDYNTAAEDGMSIFRHWFMWSAIEIAPGVFDWADYDRQLDLAAENGLKTIVAEMMTAAPEWAFRTYAHASYETRDGQRVGSHMGVSCVTGGFPGLCLDNDDAKDAAERWLRALVARYRAHPGMGGYDIWNECNYAPDTCYCAATAEKFRDWLRAKYADLQALGKAWYRYSLADWADIAPPRRVEPYPDVLDWLEFRVDNAYRLMRWRVEVIRSLDQRNRITAHGVVGTLTRAAQAGADDWRAAAEVETYGYTWGSARHGDEPWKQIHAVDLVRASARGKPFWHAEAYAGPLWMQPQVLGKPRDEGRIAAPEDIRYWDMVSFMGGARGLLYLRWRPLLDGPLFGAFGAYGMDGSRTPRSAAVSEIAEWVRAPRQEQLWLSRPVQGEVGIVYVPETERFVYAQQVDTAFYSQSLQGAYRGFLAHNIQPDWVHVDDIDAYDVLYLPLPVMLSAATAERLKRWVAAGGTLIAEGCPAYWGDRGRVGTVQPGYGLDEVFGARERYVEFTPDLLGNLQLQVLNADVWGGIFLQAYELAGGTAVGWYADGQVAAVEHRYGGGRTLLVGTMLGVGAFAHAGDGAAPFWAELLSWAGKAQHVRSSDGRIIARLHHGAGGAFLWVANPTREPIEVEVTVGDHWPALRDAAPLRGATATVDGRALQLNVPARDVTVLALWEA